MDVEKKLLEAIENGQVKTPWARASLKFAQEMNELCERKIKGPIVTEQAWELKYKYVEYVKMHKPTNAELASEMAFASRLYHRVKGE